MNCGSINEYHTLAPRKAIVHSGKVRAVEFGPRPKISVATFFTKFRVDANSYYLMDNNKKYSLKFGNLLELNIIKKKGLFGIDSRIGTALLIATVKTTFTKTLQKEERSFEWNVLKR